MSCTSKSALVNSLYLIKDTLLCCVVFLDPCTHVYIEITMCIAYRYILYSKGSFYVQGVYIDKLQDKILFHMSHLNPEIEKNEVS